MPSEHIFVNIKEGNQDYFICRAIYNKAGVGGDPLSIGTYPGSWYLDVNLTNSNYQNDNICFYVSSIIGRPIACVEPETIRPGDRPPPILHLFKIQKLLSWNFLNCHFEFKVFSGSN